MASGSEINITNKLDAIEQAIQELKDGVEEITIHVDLSDLVSELQVFETKLDLIYKALNGGE